MIGVMYIGMKKKMHDSALIGKDMLLCLLLFSIVLTSCDQRNPEAEYEVLREKVFESPHEGVEVAQEYIVHFNEDNNFWGKKKKARITEVSEIRSQYRKMDAFFSNSYGSYGDFMTASHELNYELSYSNYDGVRRTWLSLYDKLRKRLLAPIMESITGSEFDRFFQEEARKISGIEFPSWHVESVEKISMAGPILEYSGTAKNALGEYRVRLSGNKLGFPSSARFSIEGTIGPDESGKIIYTRIKYTVFDKPLFR